MKNLLFTLLLCGIFCTAMAQNITTVISGTVANPFETSVSDGNTPSVQGVIDTLDEYVTRATGMVMVTAQNGGYVFGTGWQDFGPPYGLQKLTSECGNHYTGVGNANVIKVLALFGAAVVMGNSDSVTANVYTVGADSMPTTLLGSGKVATSGIIVQNITPFTISGTANVTGDFFVSIAYGTIDDTVGIASSNPTNNDGMGEKRTRIKLAAAPQWVTADAAFGGFNADVLIVPVVDIQSGTGMVQINDIIVDGAFPNPANEETNIRLVLNRDQTARVVVFDLTGKIAFSSGEMELGMGEKNVVINTSEFSAGTYFYSVYSGKQSVTGQFSVVK